MHKLLILTGASGSGKTTIAKAFAEKESITTLYFDSIGVPSHDDMIAQFGSGENWQRAQTTQWLARIKNEHLMNRPILFEGQMRPSFIQEALRANAIIDAEILLVDCDDETRRKRLTHDRAQPELASQQMMEWSKFLRQQAQDLTVAILDTSRLSLAEAVGIVASKFGGPIVETKRLWLREVQDSDFDFLFKMFQDPEVMKFYGSVRDEAQTRGWMELCRANYRRYGHGKWIIMRKSDQKPLGHTGMIILNVDGEEAAELGYFLGREYWGNGYATEAAEAVVQLAFNRFRYKKILSTIDPQNTVSVAVAVRLGMKFEKSVAVKSGENSWRADAYMLKASV